MSEVRYRIHKSKMVLMIFIAALFDLGILASKIFYLIGLAAVGAAVGAYLGDAVGIPETGAAAGGIIGTVLTFTGIGTAFSFAIGMILAETLSWLLLITGLSTMWFWLRMEGFSMLSGEKIPEKFGAFALTAVLKFVPILNVVPMITFWTWRMTMISRWEDRKIHRDARMTEAQGRVVRSRHARRMERARRRAGLNNNDGLLYEGAA